MANDTIKKDIPTDNDYPALSDYVCTWVNSHTESIDPESVKKTYPEMMGLVLNIAFGMDKTAAELFVYQACLGNWERLHETRIEQYATAKDYAEALLNDIFYCSDRWTWDRLLRIQWLYQRLNKRCDGELERDVQL